MLQSERDVERGDVLRSIQRAYVPVLSSPTQGVSAVIIFGCSESQPEWFYYPSAFNDRGKSRESSRMATLLAKKNVEHFCTLNLGLVIHFRWMFSLNKVKSITRRSKRSLTRKSVMFVIIWKRLASIASSML